MLEEGQTQRAGVLGALERLLSTLFLRRVHMRELALLDAFAQQYDASIGADVAGSA